MTAAVPGASNRWREAAPDPPEAYSGEVRLFDFAGHEAMEDERAA